MKRKEKIRINELARQLEVKANAIVELLPEIGVKEKKTHSSSIDIESAEKVRKLIRQRESRPSGGAQPEAEEPRAAAPAAERRGGAAARPSIRVGGGGAKPLRPPVQALRPPLKPSRAPAAKPAAPARPAAAGKPRARPDTVPGGPPAPRAVPAMPAQPQAPSEAGLGRPVKPIPRRPAAGTAVGRGPRAPLAPPVRKQAPTARDAVPGAPVRPPLTRGAPAPPRPAAAGRPAPAARARTSAPGTAGRPGRAPRKPVLVPGQPIYQRPRPVVPGMPVPRPAGQPGYGPRAQHPVGRPGMPPPGVPVRPDQRRGPRPPARPIRDREAEREQRFLQQQAVKAPPTPPKAVHTEITASEGTTVKELAEKLGMKANLVIKTLVDRGMFATINQTLDLETIQNLCKHFGATATETTYEEEARLDVDMAEVPEDIHVRAPVVTVMGHVDHGKTSLLDAIRETHVADREAGGITQAIGASQIDHKGRQIVFIDTPGHEAFTRMRAHGAKVTDIVVLVVAADDGVMPQTLEAIDHAKAAEVPILVAINKIDKAGADPDRVKQQLADRGLLPEDWGGDTVMVPVSAKAKQNLDLLLEMILLVADLKELKANPNRPAVGTVLESKLDRGQGPGATVLVQNGTLRVGDYFVAGAVFGKVRALINDRGKTVEEAAPSSAVLVLGLDGLPAPGDSMQVVTDTERARKIVEFREERAREQALAKTTRLSLEQFQEQLRAGEVKELPIVLKCDVQGSMEVLHDSIAKLSTEKVKVRLIHSGVGAISKSDVLLAATANAIIVGFNVRPERSAAVLAEREKIDVRLHTVIYELVDELKKAMVGLLEPILKETIQGRAEVQQAFRVSKVGTIAGCVVQEGRVGRTHEARLLRDNVVVYTGRVSSLRRFKDDVSEARAGQECGIGLENFNDIKPGDQIEAFVTEKVAQELLV